MMSFELTASGDFLRRLLPWVSLGDFTKLFESIRRSTFGVISP